MKIHKFRYYLRIVLIIAAICSVLRWATVHNHFHLYLFILGCCVGYCFMGLYHDYRNMKKRG